MTEEIKKNNTPNNVLQALGNLTNGAINYYQLPKTTLEEENIILNYIINLQKENETNKNYCDFYKDMSNKWKDLSDEFKKNYEDYKQRNEKASAFLKHLKNTFDESDEMYDLLNNAIDILQGGDE